MNEETDSSSLITDQVNGGVHMKVNQSSSAKNSQHLAEVTTNLNGLEKCAILVTGMTCSSCVANIERHLLKCDGEYCLRFLTRSSLLRKIVFAVNFPNYFLVNKKLVSLGPVMVCVL